MLDLIPKKFEIINEQVNYIKLNAKNEYESFIYVNIFDSNNNKQLSFEEIKKFGNSQNIPTFKINLKQNIDECFNELIYMIIKNINNKVLLSDFS